MAHPGVIQASFILAITIIGWVSNSLVLLVIGLSGSAEITQNRFWLIKIQARLDMFAGAKKLPDNWPAPCCSQLPWHRLVHHIPDT